MTRESSGRASPVTNWTDSAAVGNMPVPKRAVSVPRKHRFSYFLAVFHDFEAFFDGLLDVI